MTSVWRVTTNYVCGEKLYAVYRIKDVDETDHSGNREYATEFMSDKVKANAIAAELNLRGRNSLCLK